MVGAPRSGKLKPIKALVLDGPQPAKLTINAFGLLSDAGAIERDRERDQRSLAGELRSATLVGLVIDGSDIL